ncbi:MAG: hypothetical protein K0S07_997 [Chlamydiales bacterium]|jgi:hypothetical protein|nr:hypothetical protein [Chlamydiales bacterium]
MKKWLPLLLTACVACTAGPMMNHETFERIQTGTTVGALQDMVGSPFDIELNDDGTQNYIYIERMEIGLGTTHSCTYILKVRDGKVIDKQVIEKDTPLDIKFHS